MKNQSGTTAALGCVALIVAVPLSAILRGFVLSVLWSWFVVPVFGVAALSVPLAMGLALIVGLFTGSGSTSDEKSDASVGMAITATTLRLVATPLFFLALGALIRAFV